MGRPDRPAQHAQAYPLDIISTSAGTAGRSVEPCRFAHLVPPAARESPGLNPGLAHHADQVSRQPLRQPESLPDGPLLSVPRPSQRPVGALDPIGHHSHLAGSLPAVRLRPPVDVRHPTESRWRLQVTSFQGLGPEFGHAPRIDPLLPAGCHQRPIRRRLPVPPDLPSGRRGQLRSLLWPDSLRRAMDRNQDPGRGRFVGGRRRGGPPRRGDRPSPRHSDAVGNSLFIHRRRRACQAVHRLGRAVREQTEGVASPVAANGYECSQPSCGLSS